MIYSDHPLSQREFLRINSNVNRKDFNPIFFERENSKVFDKMERIIKSCERNQYFSIKVLSFRRIENYEEVWRTLYEHEEQRRAEKKKPPKTDNPYQFIDLQDSDIMLLEVIYKIRINGDKPEEDTLRVIIMLPRFVDKYYYRLKGNYFSPIFQIVDRSTYNNTNTNNAKYPTNTFRTDFMTIRILKKNHVLQDYMSTKVINCTGYDAYIFTKTVPAHKYILAKYGLYGAMDFLGITNQINFGKEPDLRENHYCFQKGDVFISVPKFIFDNNQLVQSFIVTVWETIPMPTVVNDKKGIENDPFNDIFNPRFWISNLGTTYKDKDSPINKGIAVLNSLENVYDINAEEILLLPDEEKKSVYHILRWMMREFTRIKNKDNLDIGFKRARMYDICPALYAIKLSKGIYRISDEGRHVTMKQIKSAIYTQPDYILTVINKSKLINFSDLPNDNDAITALKYTFKGISGLGEEGNVQTSYRRVHPSHIKRFDLDSSSASDPGLTGVLAVYGDMQENGLFSDIPEPNFWQEEYDRMVNEYNNLVAQKEIVTFQKKMGFQFDNIKEEILEESIKNYKKLLCPVSDINGVVDYRNRLN